MFKATIIGHFGFGYSYSDGQTVKTKNLADCLCQEYGIENINMQDTHGGIKSLLKAPLMLLKAFKTSENVIILPAHRGIKIYAPIISFYKCFFKRKKVHYVVVGGWIHNLVKNNQFLKKSLARFDYIYTETSILKKRLFEVGLKNVTVLPNFKNINIINKENMNYPCDEPYKLCTFSRVMKEKGIEDAIMAVSEINRKYDRKVFELDIYGPIDENEHDWFTSLKNRFPNYVKYCGVIPPEKSIDIVKNYFALLFPTLFYTEGIPGTILDAYCSGVPVIASRWESYSDVVEENITGIGYEFKDINDLIRVLDEVSIFPEKILNLKKNCLEYAIHYSPNEAIKILVKNM